MDEGAILKLQAEQLGINKKNGNGKKNGNEKKNKKVVKKNETMANGKNIIKNVKNMMKTKLNKKLKEEIKNNGDKKLIKLLQKLKDRINEIVINFDNEGEQLQINLSLIGKEDYKQIKELVKEVLEEVEYKKLQIKLKDQQKRTI
jgi:hypothetical protein